MKRTSIKAKTKIENEYDKTTQELCNARGAALKSFEEMGLIVATSMRVYLDNLSDIVEKTASPDAAEALVKSAPYKNCGKAIKEFESFIKKEKERLEKRKYYHEIPYQHEVVLLFPETDIGIAKIRRKISEYRLAKSDLSRHHKEVAKTLQKEGQFLPIKYKNLLKKLAIYNNAQERSEDSPSDLFRMFPELERHYTLRLT